MPRIEVVAGDITTQDVDAVATAAGLLRSCHVEALRVADDIGAHTVAFPAISCGIYGYPLDEAAPIAVNAVREADTEVELVRFVLFGPEALRAFEVVAQG